MLSLSSRGRGGGRGVCLLKRSLLPQRRCKPKNMQLGISFAFLCAAFLSGDGAGGVSCYFRIHLGTTYGVAPVVHGAYTGLMYFR